MTDSPLREATERMRQREQEPAGSKALALRPDQDFWEPKQLAALNALGIRGASNPDLAVFQHYCLRTRLDPFTRQIYFIKRRHKEGDDWVEQWTIQVGIDGYRVIAQRAARHEGVQISYEDTIWWDKDEKPHNVWMSAEPPVGATVTVIKHLTDGRELRFPGFCRFDAYAAKNRHGTLTGQWPTMGDHMIEKCAEAFALRRAFPHDLGGMYVEEELQHTDYTPPQGKVRRAAAQEPPADWTVAGHVEQEGPAGNGQETPPPPQDEPMDEATERKAAIAKLQAVFRDCGLGRRDDVDRRVAVVTGLLNEGDATPVDHLVDIHQLTSDVLGIAVERLTGFVRDLDGAEAKAELISYAEQVMSQVTEGAKA